MSVHEGPRAWIDWAIAGFGLALIVLGCLMGASCAHVVYDEEGNVIEEWIPPSVEELIAYIELYERLEPLVDRLLDGDASEEDEKTVDRLMEFLQSPEGQALLVRADERTQALVATLQQLYGQGDE